MNSLDSLTRAGLAGSVPSADVLPLVNQGLESIRQLIAQGDTKGADTVLEFLNRLLRQRFSADATGTTTPEPFTLPHPYGIGPSLQDVQAAFAAPVGDVSPSPTGSEVPAGLESRIEGLP